MGDSLNCKTCGARGPDDVEPVPFMKAYIWLLKDWKTWVMALGIMLGLGLILGALNWGGGSAVGAGGGAAIGFLMMARVAKVRSCKKCGALLGG